MLSVLALLLVLLILAYPFLEPYTLRVRPVTLETTLLPADMRSLRIVYVSDLHVSSWPFYTQSRVASLARAINAQNPDLILLGGDYADSPEGCEAFFRALPALHANYGIYAVLGEHDRYSVQVDDAEEKAMADDALARLRAAMVAKGVTPLVNDVISIRIGSDTWIQVAGLDDITNGAPSLTEVAQKCVRDRYVIFMCHNPFVIPSLWTALGGTSTRNWFDLGLFGHTHGGQIGPLPRLLGLADNIPDASIRGIDHEGRSALITSCGIGTSVVPIRLLCPPEIHVISVRYPR